MVHGEVVGLMNGELVMGGILEGDCKDRMADRLLRSYRLVSSSLTSLFSTNMAISETRSYR